MPNTSSAKATVPDSLRKRVNALRADSVFVMEADGSNQRPLGPSDKCGKAIYDYLHDKMSLSNDGRWRLTVETTSSGTSVFLRDKLSYMWLVGMPLLFTVIMGIPNFGGNQRPSNFTPGLRIENQDTDFLGRVLVEELGRYEPGLLDRPRLVVGTKADVAPPDVQFEGMRISAVTHEGLGPFLGATLTGGWALARRDIAAGTVTLALVVLALGGALVVAAAKAGLDRSELERRFPRVDEIPFSSESKRMTTLHETEDGVVAYAKGAPEVILASCTRKLDASGETELDADNPQEVQQRLIEQADVFGKHHTALVGVVHSSDDLQRITAAEQRGRAADARRALLVVAERLFNGRHIEAPMVWKLLIFRRHHRQRHLRRNVVHRHPVRMSDVAEVAAQPGADLPLHHHGGKRHRQEGEGHNAQHPQADNRDDAAFQPIPRTQPPPSADRFAHSASSSTRATSLSMPTAACAIDGASI